MDEPLTQTAPVVGAAKKWVRRLLAVLENRLELLALEMQEESERLIWMFFLAIGMAALSLLAAIGFSAAVVIALWEHSRLAALLVLTASYALAALILCLRLMALWKNRQTLPDTIDQLKKDRQCLEKRLS